MSTQNTVGFRTLSLVASASLFFGIARSVSAGDAAKSLRDTYGPRYEVPPVLPTRKTPKLSHGNDALGHILNWNEIAINASGLDHTPPAPGENRVFHEQLGPGRASRAIAIVHIAMFDAVNSISGGYQSYTGIARVHVYTSVEAAIAQAAHDTLVALFPAQASSFDQFLVDDLKQIQNS